ncbi:MAG: preprotein translocase subunit YajC, partial [Pseudobdellovibrio sp.]
MFNVLFSSLKSFADIAAPAAAQATAQTTEATTAVAPSAPAWMQFVPFIVILGVMYFIVIRPQAKKQKETQDFLGALRVGDQVVTQAGILGRVTALTDSIVTL